MKTVWKLLLKDYRLFWADKVAVSLTFIVPALLIFILGNVFSGMGSGGDMSGLRLAVVNESSDPLALKLEKTLDNSENFRTYKSYTDENGQKVLFDENTVQDYIRSGDARAALVIPADALTDTTRGLKLKFFYDPRNDIEMGMIEGLLQQTIFQNMPSLFLNGLQHEARDFLGADSARAFNSELAKTISNYFGVDSARVFDPDWITVDPDTSGSAAADSAQSDFFQNILQMEKTQIVGQDVENPMVTRSVGGWAIMFLLFSLTGAASSLFEEKQSGVILRMLAAPVSRTHILWSKYLHGMTLGLIQLLALFFTGWLLFDVDIFSNFFNLIVISLAAATASTAFGMLLASLSKTQAQANGLGTFLILAMSALGGAWFPTFLMPDFIQYVSQFTLVYWAMEGFMKVLWTGEGFIQILPEVGVLLLIAALVNVISIWRFRKGHVFE